MGEDEDALCTICDFEKRRICAREFRTRPMFQYDRAEAPAFAEGNSKLEGNTSFDPQSFVPDREEQSSGWIENLF